MVDPRSGRRHARPSDWRPRHVNRTGRRDWRARTVAGLTVLVFLAPPALVDAAPPPGVVPPAPPTPYRVITQFDLREGDPPDDRRKVLPTVRPSDAPASSPAPSPPERDEANRKRCKRR